MWFISTKERKQASQSTRARPKHRSKSSNLPLFRKRGCQVSIEKGRSYVVRTPVMRTVCLPHTKSRNYLQPMVKYNKNRCRVCNHCSCCIKKDKSVYIQQRNRARKTKQQHSFSLQQEESTRKIFITSRTAFTAPKYTEVRNSKQQYERLWNYAGRQYDVGLRPAHLQRSK